jgi:hypothetical protein
MELPSTAFRVFRREADTKKNPIAAPFKLRGREYFVRTLKQTCSQDCPRAPLAFKDSMTHVFCNSHYVSHFAAFFIDVGAKISSVTSFIFLVSFLLWFFMVGFK